MCFNRSSLQQDSGIPEEIESFPFIQGCKVSDLGEMSHCKFQEIIPRSDGAWCSQQHNRLIHGESLGNVFFPYHFHNFTVLGALAGIPKQAYRATGPTD